MRAVGVILVLSAGVVHAQPRWSADLGAGPAHVHAEFTGSYDRYKPLVVAGAGIVLVPQSDPPVSVVARVRAAVAPTGEHHAATAFAGVGLRYSAGRAWAEATIGGSYEYFLGKRTRTTLGVALQLRVGVSWGPWFAALETAPRIASVDGSTDMDMVRVDGLSAALGHVFGR